MMMGMPEQGRMTAFLFSVASWLLVIVFLVAWWRGLW